MVEHVEQGVVLPERKAERDRQRRNADDQSRPQLVYVRQDREASLVADCPGAHLTLGVSSSSVAAASGSGGFASCPIELLNSLSPWPSARPASGSRLGPRKMSATPRRMIRWVGWRSPVNMSCVLWSRCWMRLGDVAVSGVGCSCQLHERPEELL